MPKRQPALPSLGLVSDARNDARLERVLARLPRNSGLIFRHYHLAPDERRRRIKQLALIAGRCGHTVVLSGPVRLARSWGAAGAYGPPAILARGGAALRLVTAHSLREIAQARRVRADAIVLAPVFPTASHPGREPRGALRFRLLAVRSGVPVLALGGMTARRARSLGGAKWAAIDGLSDKATRRIPKDS